PVFAHCQIFAPALPPVLICPSKSVTQWRVLWQYRCNNKTNEKLQSLNHSWVIKLRTLAKCLMNSKTQSSKVLRNPVI
ncbi:hypothetical protein L9G15_25705, partial [Shewanella sp. A3A]|nr:hypothetical protein [Shewanella ferrihydritica]